MLSKLTVLLSFLLISVKVLAAEYWIDVRTAEEYQQGHVDVAVNILHTEIATKINNVTSDKDATIYLYCRSGRRASIAEKALEDLGYTQVKNLGGLDDARKFQANK
jgi:phage shock protein E